MSFLIIIRGPLGIGKSTLAHHLAKKINAKIIAIDRVLDKHNLTRHKERGFISQKSFIKANVLMIPKIKAYFKKGFPVIVEGNFYWKSQIDDLLQRIKQPTFVFTLKAPLPLCIERDRTRSQTCGKDAARVVYKKSTEFKYGIMIDVSKRTITQSVKEIVRHLPFKN
ncbi:TPA: ATP-binding protein [Candidatus Woesearchaeota archaeon]|nr:ATP-binding protein [Candidatus Woesearchaeota archaeon]